MLKRVGFALKSSLTNLFPKTAKQKIDFPQRTYQNDCWPNETFVFLFKKVSFKRFIICDDFLRDSFIICLVGQETDKDLISRIYIVLFTFILLRQVYLNSFVRDTKKIGQCMQERRKFIKKGDCFKKENRT